MSSRARLAALVIGAAVAIAFALLVWPTVYRPIPLLAPPEGMRDVVAARENRITGEVQWLPALSHQWVTGGTAGAVASSPPPWR